MSDEHKLRVSGSDSDTPTSSRSQSSPSPVHHHGPAPITAGQQMVASCSGAMLTSLFVTPLDVVKIRLQAQQKPFTKGTCFIYHNGLMDHLCMCSQCGNGAANGAANSAARSFSAVNGAGASNGAACSILPQTRPWYLKNGAFNGTLDAFVKITRTEGIASLWSGLPPTLVMAIPATVIYFTSYDRLKYAMGYKEGDPTTQFIPPLAGAAARVFAATMICPLELVRTKLQSEQLSYRDIGRAIRITVTQGGPLSMMRGLAPTLMRDVPFSAVYWFGYEYLKAKQMAYSGVDVPKYHQCMLAGAVSGTVAGVMTLPFDVVKTHRQIELGEAAIMHTKGKASSTWTIIHRLYHQNGVRALFAGIVPRIAKVAPACGIMISTYEYSKLFFMQYNAQQELLALDGR